MVHDGLQYTKGAYRGLGRHYECYLDLVFVIVHVHVVPLHFNKVIHLTFIGFGHVLGRESVRERQRGLPRA